MSAKRWTRVGVDSGPANTFNGRWLVARPPSRKTGYGVLDTTTGNWVMTTWSSPPLRKVWRRMADAKSWVEAQALAGRLA